MIILSYPLQSHGLENDSPSRGRKLQNPRISQLIEPSGLENDSPSRGRKRFSTVQLRRCHRLENDSPSRGRKPYELSYMLYDESDECLENDSPSRGRKLSGYNVLAVLDGQ